MVCGLPSGRSPRTNRTSCRATDAQGIDLVGMHHCVRRSLSNRIRGRRGGPNAPPVAFIAALMVLDLSVPPLCSGLTGWPRHLRASGKTTPSADPVCPAGDGGEAAGWALGNKSKTLGPARRFFRRGAIAPTGSSCQLSCTAAGWLRTTAYRRKLHHSKSGWLALASALRVGPVARVALGGGL